MTQTQLGSDIDAHRGWCERHAVALERLTVWLQKHGLFDDETASAIRLAATALQERQLSVAVVGEFSRGKTELINALFFHDLGFRLLPTDAGRTTMCPVEIYQDDTEPLGLHLLPLDSRRDDLTLQELRRDPARWHHLPLALHDEAAVRECLGELTRVDEVPAASARALGLPVEPGRHSVSVPRWRLARLNVHHPLLAAGLRVLDTPGLNALGTEPELTYDILPGAHAVVFVLSADTGVTRSDLDVWRLLGRHQATAQTRQHLVALNKVDTLWDELRHPDDIARSIHEQCRSVAQTLAIEPAQVFAVSAQKALLARVRADAALAQAANLGCLEGHLGEVLLAQQERLLRQQYLGRVEQALDGTARRVSTRLQRNAGLRSQLRQVSEEGQESLERNLAALQKEHLAYRQSAAALEQTRGRFTELGGELRRTLDPISLDTLIEHAHGQMTGAWTTPGLKRAMELLFLNINGRMLRASETLRQMRKQLRLLQHHVQNALELDLDNLQFLSLGEHEVDLKLLHQEAEAFRNSAILTLSEQHFVVKRYFRMIVNRVRDTFIKAAGEADDWLTSALMPISMHLDVHRDLLNQQISELRQARESTTSIQLRLEALEEEHRRLRAELASLEMARTRFTGNPATSPAADTATSAPAAVEPDTPDPQAAGLSRESAA